MNTTTFTIYSLGRIAPFILINIEDLLHPLLFMFMFMLVVVLIVCVPIALMCVIILKTTKTKQLRQSTSWLDVYFGKFKLYRNYRKGIWYKHKFTKDAEELTFTQGETWWARYGKINRYSDVVLVENVK